MKNLKKICVILLEIIFPNHCFCCNKIINKEKIFCELCQEKIEPISNPKCLICSHPFEAETKCTEHICSKCLTKKPSYKKAIGLFRYNTIIKKPITNMKYHDQSFLAKKFAQIMVENSKDEISNCDIIVAVPMQFDRLRKRKFNQVVLLAKNITKLAPALRFFPDFLLKVKSTKPQSQLKRRDRENNLKQAFLVNPKYHNLIQGKKILLVDDVITTGTTIENCAKELKRRGALEVTVLAIAKTVFNKL